jgi:hypothetical protein
VVTDGVTWTEEVVAPVDHTTEVAPSVLMEMVNCVPEQMTASFWLIRFWQTAEA